LGEVKKVDRDMFINDLLEVDEDINFLLLKEGMHCIGCLSAIGETLEEACIVHGLDVDRVERDINAFLAAKAETRA